MSICISSIEELAGIALYYMSGDPSKNRPMLRLACGVLVDVQLAQIQAFRHQYGRDPETEPAEATAIAERAIALHAQRPSLEMVRHSIWVMEYNTHTRDGCNFLSPKAQHRLNAVLKFVTKNMEKR